MKILIIPTFTARRGTQQWRALASALIFLLHLALELSAPFIGRYSWSFSGLILILILASLRLFYQLPLIDRKKCKGPLFPYTSPSLCYPRSERHEKSGTHCSQRRQTSGRTGNVPLQWGSSRHQGILWLEAWGSSAGHSLPSRSPPANNSTKVSV